MHLEDVSLLLKKIAVGVVVPAIPFLVFGGGLWLTRAMLDRPHNHAISAPSHSNQ
jgi:hypothetical protein